jgi:hypothetical protein
VSALRVGSQTDGRTAKPIVCDATAGSALATVPGSWTMGAPRTTAALTTDACRVSLADLVLRRLARRAAGGPPQG